MGKNEVTWKVIVNREKVWGQNTKVDDDKGPVLNDKRKKIQKDGRTKKSKGVLQSREERVSGRSSNQVIKVYWELD